MSVSSTLVTTKGVMTMLWTILAGAFIGWIASMIMGTDQQMGAIANIVAGLVGAWVGGFISSMLGMGAFGAGFSLPALLFGVLGACIAIGIYKAITGQRPVLH